MSVNKNEVNTQTEDIQKIYTTIPYVEGQSEEIRRVCGRYGIKVAFKSNGTLRDKLTKVKDKLPVKKNSKVVYKIPCSCGKFYLGETVRRLETRLKEHIDACEKGMWEKSAIAEHAWVEGHRILWEEASIVDRARRQTELLMKEALHIRSETPNDILNRDGGLDIHGCWVETIKTLKQRQETESAQAIYTNSL